MKLEAIGSAVWVAKKRYAMSMISFKGVYLNPPKLKLQGIDAVRSSTPKVCRDAIEEAIPLIIGGKEKELKVFVNDLQNKFNKLKFHEVAFPRGTNDLEKYADKDVIYGKKTPPHVRGALLYNHIVKEKKLTNELPLIRSGDKIRFCYMKLPNPLRENIFACPDELPEELGMAEFIDYQTQFEKTFLEPLQHIIRAAGIRLTNDVDISQFFVKES